LKFKILIGKFYHNNLNIKHNSRVQRKMKTKISEFFITSDAKIKEALKKMDLTGQKILFVGSGGMYWTESFLTGIFVDTFYEQVLFLVASLIAITISRLLQKQNRIPTG
jgi:hypothetical protein